MPQNSEVDRKQKQANADMQDGLPPEAQDASDPTQAILDHVQVGPRRRIKIGEVLKGGKTIPLYSYAATERAMVLNQTTGEFEFIQAGDLDELSNQHIHRDQEPTESLHVADNLDIAYVANKPSDGTARRRRIVAEKPKIKPSGTS